MKYVVLTPGGIGDVVVVPKSVVDEHLRFASAKQLKAVLYIISKGGTSQTSDIAEFIGCDEEEADDIMEYWFSSAVVSKDSRKFEATLEKAPQSAQAEKGGVTTVKLSLNDKEMRVTKVMEPPRLTPSDIVKRAEEDKGISCLLNEGQNILGRTIAHSEQEMIVNMVDYYGLETEVVLMILDYAKSVNKANTRYIMSLAKNWSDEEIDSVEKVEEKLKEIESCNSAWDTIRRIAELPAKTPTAKQRDFVNTWLNKYRFTYEIIADAFEIAKDNEIKKVFPYVNKILSEWFEKGVDNTAAQIKKGKKAVKGKAQKAALTSSPTYDLEQITKDSIAETLNFGG